MGATQCKWLAAVALALAACGKHEAASAPVPLGNAAAAVSAGGDRKESAFVDRTREVGIDFVHSNGMSGQRYFAEVVGPGAAFLDWDSDGDLDLYLVQGGPLGQPPDATAPAPTASPSPGGRLYRNDLVVRSDGSRDLRFTDVTADSELRATGYGMGVAAADYDNDGWTDLYLTNFGPNQLWHNDGDGTWSDRTVASGTDDPRWSTSASFADVDGDGWLDLYIVNYVDFTIARHRPCRIVSGRIDYCGPATYESTPDRLLRNRRDGTFEDVSASVGIARVYGTGLGIASADFDGDRRVDLFVANDQEPDFLWMNLGGGRLENRALLAGCAVSGSGTPTSSMGVVAGDFDNDGDEDLFIANLAGEVHTLFVNDGRGTFEDRSLQAGVAYPSIPFTSFGVGLIDYDNDGWLDLLVANGEVKEDETQLRAGEPFPLKQRKLLLRNLGQGRFVETTVEGGAALQAEEVSRGLAVGDVDNDGDSDVLVANNNGPPRLLINGVEGVPWLGIGLARSGFRDASGAQVRLLLRDGGSLWRRAHTDGSYLSAGDPRVLFGLGDREAADAVSVSWPYGQIETFAMPPLGRYTTLREGAGRPVEAPSGG